MQGLDNEGHMHIDYKEQPVTLGDGTVVSLRHPTYSIDGLKYGPLHPETMLSPRIAPPMIGVGLLEAIPEDQIRAHADPDDKDKDGISGRANEVWSLETNKTALGRFGWKAGKPTVREQAASAFAGDMGLSSPLFAPTLRATARRRSRPACNAPNGNTRARRRPRGQRQAVRPRRVLFAEPRRAAAPQFQRSAQVNRGKALFYALGCQSCHTPSFTTGKVEGQPHLSRTRRSGPTPTCCCTTWAKVSPTTGPRAWPTGANGARRRCGASA